MATQPDTFLGGEVLLLSNNAPSKLLQVPSLGQIACIAYFQCAAIVDSNGNGNVAVRWSDDPNNPPTALLNGFELSPGGVFVTCCNLLNFQFIGVAPNARLNVRYEAWPSALHKFF